MTPLNKLLSFLKCRYIGNIGKMISTTVVQFSRNQVYMLESPERLGKDKGEN